MLGKALSTILIVVFLISTLVGCDDTTAASVASVALAPIEQTMELLQTVKLSAAPAQARTFAEVSSFAVQVDEAENEPLAPAPVPVLINSSAIKLKDISMAEMVRQQEDRIFDYSFSLRMVKRDNISYYIRFSTLFMDDGTKSTKILDNANFYWMYIDESHHLWFGLKGNIVISDRQVSDKEYLYKYDYKKNEFMLIKTENSNCTFSNRFYKNYFLYVEYGRLKAYNTSNDVVYIIGKATNPSVIVLADTIYYEGVGGKQIMLTDFGKKGSRKRTLKLSNFPLGDFAFDEYLVVNGKTTNSLYEFIGTGYRKLCAFAPLSGWTDGLKPFYVTEYGICVLGDANRSAYIDFYDFRTKKWNQVGDKGPIDQYGYSGNESWFYTYSAPLSLNVIKDTQFTQYDFGDLVDYCTDIQIDGSKAFIYQYDGFWLSYFFDMETNVLYRISD